jgi:hypothetical protein
MGGKVYDDLVEGIRERRVLVVVGAGVAVQATGNDPVASWIGLLRNGVDRVAELNRAPSPGWKKSQFDVLDSVTAGAADTRDLIGVAQQVADRLGWRRDIEWYLWLRDSVGALAPTTTGRRLLAAIDALDIPIATTNYDGLLESATRLSSVSWSQTKEVVRLLQAKKRGILHLHGFWERADDVVLGISSYEDLIGRGTAQHLKDVLPTLYSLLYVGCGAGMTDPNFGKLREWIRGVMFETEHRHVRLALDHEVCDLQKEHPDLERTIVLGYGSTFDDLVPFLEALARDAGCVPASGTPTISSARRLKLTEIPEQCSYADERYASCCIHAPQGTPEDRFEVKFRATFGRLPAQTAPPLVRVEIEVTMPKGRGAERILGSDGKYHCADGPSIRLCRTTTTVPRWEIAAPKGESLHEHNAEADAIPLFALPAAAVGDSLTLRMAVFPNKAFFDGPWVPYAVLEGDQGRKMRDKIIRRIRVTPLGDPQAHGEMILCETTNVVEEQS